LATGSDGLAEVEFENNSTLRLGENSEIQFTKLLNDDNGAKVNEVQLLKGTVYFDTKGNKEDIYRATVGSSAFRVHRDTQLRLSDNDGTATASVLKGEVELENQQHDVKVGKKQTLTLEPNGASGYQIAKGVDAQPLDRWNDERSAYQQSYSYSNPGVSSGLNSYGYATSTTTVDGRTCPVLDMAGSLMAFPTGWAGTRISRAPGRFIPDSVTRGLPPIPGDGCRITTVHGPTSAEGAGSGFPAVAALIATMAGTPIASSQPRSCMVLRDGLRQVGPWLLPPVGLPMRQPSGWGPLATCPPQFQEDACLPISAAWFP